MLTKKVGAASLMMQSRALAGRCFRKTQWVFYGVAGVSVAALVFQPLWESLYGVTQFRLSTLISELSLIRTLDQVLGIGDLLRVLAQNIVLGVPMALFGASVGIAQSAAIRKDGIAASRWMVVCALGYYACQVIGESAVFYIDDLAVQGVIRSFVKGAVLGLIAARPVERVLFSQR